MCPASPQDFARLYRNCQAPITRLDCGQKCAPYNERGVPFCCDVGHTIPTAYQAEWVYLQDNTDLWKPFTGELAAPDRDSLPSSQIAIQCLGHQLCQRGYRSIACRSFPFFPYLTRQRDYIGLTYYWDYEDRCWVISHLSEITPEYLAQFIQVFEELFQLFPEEIENFHYQSTQMRRSFGRMKRAIPLLHRNGRFYKITPHNGRQRAVNKQALPQFGPYRIAANLPFPEEQPG